MTTLKLSNRQGECPFCLAHGEFVTTDMDVDSERSAFMQRCERCGEKYLDLFKHSYIGGTEFREATINQLPDQQYKTSFELLELN